MQNTTHGPDIGAAAEARNADDARSRATDAMVAGYAAIAERRERAEAVPHSAEGDRQRDTAALLDGIHGDRINSASADARLRAGYADLEARRNHDQKDH